jgi:hypothetical protein
MKHFSISRIGRLPAASLLFVLFTAFSACEDDPKSEPDLTKDIVGEYIGTLRMDTDETTNVKLTIEKVDRQKVIIRPQLPGATAFRATITSSSSQGTVLEGVEAENSGHSLTGSFPMVFQPASSALTYGGYSTVNGQSRYESFQGNKRQ